MSQNICEYLREEVINGLYRVPTVRNAFPIWKPIIQNFIGSINATNVINLGDHLKDIFESTSPVVKDRTQSAVSSAGTAWESIVCWYLNLCLIGTRTVVIKHLKPLIPDPMDKAITVMYGNFPSNTESDLIAITFPNNTEYTVTDKYNIAIKNSQGNLVNTATASSKFNYKDVIDALVERDFPRTEVGIIQCKTNWNDNAQIPMLWDMVYSSTQFVRSNIRVGTSGYDIHDLQKFSYSFVTVPTVKSVINSTSTCVKRVENLSGGNYWGKPSQAGIAKALKEIFNNNFKSTFSKGGIRPSLDNELSKLSTEYSYFNII